MAYFQLTPECVRANVIFGLPDHDWRIKCMEQLSDDDLQHELDGGRYDCPWDRDSDNRREQDSFYEWLDSTCPDVMRAAARTCGIDYAALIDQQLAEHSEDSWRI